MKKYLILIVVFCTLISCENTKKNEESTDKNTANVASNLENQPKKEETTAKETDKKGGTPAFKFEKMKHDFGEIKEGEVVKYTFKFTNTGNAPLIIQNASASCGCTVPQYPKEPIAPNSSGEILVEYNSSGKSGMQNKTVTITANTEPAITTLEIQVNVNSIAAMDGPLKK